MLTNLSLFSGFGGLDLSAKWCGIKTVCYVENDPYAQAILLSRMRDGDIDDAPIFEDIRTFRGTSLRGSIDVVSGGFPCQDLSIAGKQVGIEKGERSGLWREFARIICEVRPRFVLVENVPGLIYTRGIESVLGSLAQAGYDAEWFCLSASDVGALHKRERVWIIAYPKGQQNRWQIHRWFQPDFRTSDFMGYSNRIGKIRQESKNRQRRRSLLSSQRSDVADSKSLRHEYREGTFKSGTDRQPSECGTLLNSSIERFPDWAGGKVGQPYPLSEFERPNGQVEQAGKKPVRVFREIERDFCGMAHGVSNRVQRLRCLGNAVVPQQARKAWEKIVNMSGRT